MRINTRFTVAVHILALLALGSDEHTTSELMAASVGNHPVVIRRTMSALKKAGLVETRNGVAGGRLALPPEEITLRAVYGAVKDGSVFEFHPNPSCDCPVGRNIKAALAGPLGDAERALENALEKYTLADITADIVDKYNAENNK